MLEKFWPSRSFTSKTEEAEQKIEAQKAVQKYVAWNEANENQLIGSEVEFLFLLDGRMIKGRMDRIERASDGGYIVTDFKTTVTGEFSTTIGQNIQMNLYCLAVQNKYGQLPVRASLVYLKGRKKPVHYYPDPIQIQSQEERLRALMDNVIHEQFDPPAVPSSKGTCRWCGYKTECSTDGAI